MQAASAARPALAFQSITAFAAAAAGESPAASTHRHTIRAAPEVIGNGKVDTGSLLAVFGFEAGMLPRRGLKVLGVPRENPGNFGVTSSYG
jgi:hypothetical protein